MPVIVDTNCFANVFCRSSAKHEDFKPVLTWIIEGKGLLIYGGSKYKCELKKANKYLKIFRLLREIGKAINKDDMAIDSFQSSIESELTEESFNDVHLLAIAVVAKCRVICSEDIASIKFVTSKKYLPKGAIKPVYYTSSKNKNLLCDSYVDDSLKPLCKISKKLAENFYKNLS